MRAPRTKIRAVIRHRLLVPLSMLLLSLTGCSQWYGEPGSFDRTLNISGPVRIELKNGSGDVRITGGPPGVVQIHCQFRVRVWPGQDPKRLIADVEAHPPVQQDESLVRIGNDVQAWSDVEFDYTIQTPPTTEAHVVTGSGDVILNSIQGPANLTSGSGDITANQVGNDSTVTTGSGTIELEQIDGMVEANAGSGDITLRDIQRSLSAHAGSGDITIERPAQDVSLLVGSGDVEITNPAGDVRVRTGSGDIQIHGGPVNAAYWELHSGAGDITLGVPSTASFRLYAHSGFGSIDTSLPITIEEKTSSRELRGVVGSGRARVEAQTSSGDIEIR